MTGVLRGGGEVSLVMQSLDWAATPAGPREQWPQSLRTALGICIASRLPTVLWWGPQLLLFYNDAARNSFGLTVPAETLGQPTSVAWPLAWPQVGAVLRAIHEQAEPTLSGDLLVLPDPRSAQGVRSFVGSYSPIPDEAGGVGGVFCTYSEVSAHVVAAPTPQPLQPSTPYAAQEGDRLPKEASSTLRQSEARLRLALQAAQMVAWEWDVTENRITTTDTFAQIYGLPAIQMVEKGMQLVHPDDRARHQETVQQVRALGGSYHSTFRITRPDTGQVVWLEEWGYTQVDARGAVRSVVGVTRDITASKVVEVALRTSEARATLALEVAQLGTWSWDPARGLVEADVRCRQICGLDAAAALAFADIAPRVHPDDWPRVETALLAALQPEGDGRYTEEFRFVHPDGAIRWVISRGQTLFDETGLMKRPVQMLGTVIDITERAEAEAALRQREARLRLVTDAMPALVSYVDTERRYRFVNRAYTEWFGRPIEAVRDHSIWEVLGEAAYQAARPEIERVLSGEHVTFERLVPYRDGGSRYIQASYIPDRDDNGKVSGYFALIIDLSERKRIEDALRQSEAQYRTLTELSLHMVWTLAPDGEITYLSQKWFDYTGLSWEEVRHSGWRRALHPDEYQAVSNVLRRYLVEGSEYAMELRLRARDGSYRWHLTRAAPITDAHGAVLRWLGVTIDIDQRKQSEETLRQSEERYRQLANAMPQLVWTGDAAGVVHYYNARAADYAGLTQRPDGTWSWAAVVHPDDQEATALAWEAAQTTALYQHEHRLQMQDGNYRWHLSRAHALHAEDGQISAWFGTATDIHERKRAERVDHFLYQLFEATRRLTAPEAITAVTARLLGEHLGADRCAYAEVEDDENHFQLTGDYTTPGTRSIVGQFAMSDFGAEVLRLMRLGEPYVVEDSASDPRISDHSIYRDTQIVAVVCVPLRKEGRFVAAMAVHQRQQRHWTADEVELVQLAANLCWEAIARTRSERALRASEERYRSLIQATTSMVWTTDAAGGFVEPQPEWATYTGQGWPEHQGWGWTIMIHPDDRASVQAAWATAVAHQRTYEGCGRLWHRASQSYRFFVARATPVQTPEGEIREWIGTVTDIHEQKLAEQAAASAAARTLRLQQITAALGAALTPADVGRVVVEESVAALGAALGSVRQLSEDGATLEEVYIRDEDVPLVAPWRSISMTANAPLTDAVRTGSPVWLESLVAVQERYPDLMPVVQARQYVALAALPLIIDARVVGAMALSFAQARRFSPEDQGFLQAVAQQCAQALERTRLYEAEQRSRAEAEAAVRLRDQFFSVAAHELKTPLTSLLGNAQLLLRRAEREGLLGERERRNVEVIIAQVQRLNRLVLALLDVSRMETGQLAIEREPVDVCALIVRLVEEARPGFEGRPVELVGLDEPLIVTGDALRLEQVLQNLLQNALKYSAYPSSIQVVVSRQEGVVRIAVTDQGIGIPAANLRRLFQRFYRADNVDPRQVSGTGIGLYVVKEIVTLHGGKVEVASVEGQGSTFTVVLPLATINGEHETKDM